jgi:predicted dehydrogenase
MELKAAIIGAGRIGVGFANDILRWPAGTHLQAYKMVPGVWVEAIADPDEEVRRIARIPTYADAEEMLSAVRPDIVSICTPPDQRRRLIGLCVDYGVKAVFCEKPLALSGKEAEFIVDLCRASRVSLLVNCQRRFSPIHTYFGVQMSVGKYGQPSWARAVYTAGLWNTCPHLIDLLLMYFGRIHRVTARYGKAVCDKPGDLNVDGQLHFYSGLTLELVALRSKPYTEFGFSVYAPSGQFYTGNHGMSLYHRMVRPSTAFANCNELADPVLLGNCESSTLIPLGIQRLIDQIPLPRVDTRAVHVVNVLEALEESAKDGGTHVEIGDSWGLPNSH